MNHPLNTILYGPPGTGKTYATFQRCVEICDRSAAGKKAEEIHARYRKLVDEGRVEFITFHQSYGYEEFVEGLRPESGGDGGGLRLTVRDGVLKRVAERARQAPPAARTRKRKFVKIDLREEDVFEECMKSGHVRFGDDTHRSDENWSDARYGTSYDACLDHFAERWGPGSKRWWGSTSAATFRAWVNQGDIVVVPDGSSRSTYRAVGEIVGDYEYAPRSSSPLWPHRRAVRWLPVKEGNPPPVKNFQDKNFGGQRVHELNPDRPEALLKYLGTETNPLRYVLVIDEINRANIAKVLGELITLLEDDKREGAENELAVTLPHSEKRFKLPGNLHVLGTMNTADRSIALLDTALRRRFAFEEITPDAHLLEGAKQETGVNLPTVLRVMNDRLEWLLSRDNLIGHAWFLTAKSREDVDEVMRRKVIPLIAEYFHEEWEKVRAVLGGTDAGLRQSRLLTVGELGEICAAEHGLTPEDINLLHGAAQRAARPLGLPEDAVLKRTEEGLTAKQVVGVLTAPGFTIEILPKVDGDDGAVRMALVHMLAVARDIKVAYGELAAMDTQRHDLLELLIRLFTERLLAAVRRGLPRRYVLHEQDLGVLRGTLRVKRQFTSLTPRSIACSRPP